MIVVILCIFGAIATLAQPLLVGLLIGRVQAGEPLDMIVWGVFALVVAASVITGFQHFLLQRTGTAVVYSSRRKLIGRILHLPISEFDARRTAISSCGSAPTRLCCTPSSHRVSPMPSETAWSSSAPSWRWRSSTPRNWVSSSS